MTFDAYEVFPFSTNANAYMAIKNKVAYRFPEKTDWQIYYFDGSTFSIQLDVSADEIEAGEWKVLEEMDINQYSYESPQSWVFIKKSEDVHISAMKEINGIDYADIYSFEFPE